LVLLYSPQIVSDATACHHWKAFVRHSLVIGHAVSNEVIVLVQATCHTCLTLSNLLSSVISSRPICAHQLQCISTVLLLLSITWQ
jgi:hypothetical protein